MKKKLRILLCSPYGGIPGGISRWTEHIINYYNNLQLKPIELDLVPMGRTLFVSTSSNLIYRILAALIDYRKILHNFFHCLNNKQYDIVHLTSSGSLSLLKDAYMLQRANKHGCKSIIHFRYGRIPDVLKTNNWEGKLIRKVVSLANSVIVIDQLSFNALKPIVKDKLHFLPNPITNEVFDIIAQNQGVKRETNMLLFVGHLIPTKGVYELVEACKTVPNIKLKMVGHVEEEMRNKLMKIGNYNWLEIAGEEEYTNIICDMLSCSLFVLPTYTEGFPNVILESMACACPIITTPVGAIPEMLDVENAAFCGKLVAIKNIDELKNSIQYYLTNFDEALAMGLRAQKRVKEKYSINVVWNQLINIWNQTATTNK